MDTVIINISELAGNVGMSITEVAQTLEVTVNELAGDVKISIDELAQTLNVTVNEVLGVNGLSAYQIALQNGFVGTEQQWLLSLNGAGNGGDNPIYIAGEALVSHQPIALVGGLAYKMNYLNPLHQFAFIGFSKTSASVSGTIAVETVKIELAGWGLLPNQTYMAGENGGLITTNNISNTFSKIIGFAQSPTSMLIVKGYTSINKN